MSQFDPAISLIFKHEGGFVNDAKDVGGVTNRGISLRFLKSLTHNEPVLLSQVDLNKNKEIDAYDIRYMTLQEATDLYRKEWWEKYKYGNIQDQKLATKLFDLSVNIGPSEAAKLIQKAYYQLTSANFLLVNGMLGSSAFKSINELDEEKTKKLLPIFCDLAAYYYRMIAEKNPAFSKFLSGWLNRVYDCG